jgi:hypothetical protein
MRWLPWSKRKDSEPDWGHAHLWACELPDGAMIHVKENGAQIGKVWVGDVTGGTGRDIEDYLLETPKYGPGHYALCAYYDGAFRGRHMHVLVGRRSQWRRGSTRAEAEAVVKRERMTPADRQLHGFQQLARAVKGN